MQRLHLLSCGLIFHLVSHQRYMSFYVIFTISIDSALLFYDIALWCIISLPQILDPIHPGQQLPLPLHLAEAGCVRWRPTGNSYLWSEAHNLSNLLSINGDVGNLKSFMCYPSLPSSHPFRCCMSVKSVSLSSSGRLKNNVSTDDAKRYIHHFILSAPLVVYNYLPEEMLLISESGGVDHTVKVSEVCDSPFFVYIVDNILRNW